MESSWPQRATSGFSAEVGLCGEDRLARPLTFLSAQGTECVRALLPRELSLLSPLAFCVGGLTLVTRVVCYWFPSGDTLTRNQARPGATST